MRKSFAIVAAACLLGLSSAANAAVVQLNISGTVVGTQTTLVCTSTPCPAPTPLGQSYAATFTQSLMPFDLKEGDNAFSFGALSGIGLYTGTINNNGGVLTGLNLYYSYQNPGVARQTVGSSYIFAKASTFNVTTVAPVPEPGTWALMLIGFGAVGTAMRRAPRRTLQAA